jgi:hypothetical protein
MAMTKARAAREEIERLAREKVLEAEHLVKLAELEVIVQGYDDATRRFAGGMGDSRAREEMLQLGGILHDDGLWTLLEFYRRHRKTT